MRIRRTPHIDDPAGELALAQARDAERARFADVPGSAREQRALEGILGALGAASQGEPSDPLVPEPAHLLQRRRRRALWWKVAAGALLALLFTGGVLAGIGFADEQEAPGPTVSTREKHVEPRFEIVRVTPASDTKRPAAKKRRKAKPAFNIDATNPTSGGTTSAGGSSSGGSSGGGGSGSGAGGSGSGTGSGTGSGSGSGTGSGGGSTPCSGSTCGSGGGSTCDPATGIGCGGGGGGGGGGACTLCGPGGITNSAKPTHTPSPTSPEAPDAPDSAGGRA